MTLFPILLIALAVAAFAIYFVPSLRNYVLVKLGLKLDLGNMLSNLTKLVKNLEQHAEDEVQKAEALFAHANIAKANADKAAVVAKNVKTLIAG